MDNQMAYKPMYKCAICGEIYDTIAERIQCETKCLKKQEEEEKKAAEAKKQAEQKDRKAAVDSLVRQTMEAIKEYCADYGYYELEDYNEDFMWPSKFGTIFYKMEVSI